MPKNCTRIVYREKVFLLHGNGGCYVHDDCFTCPLPDGICVWNPHASIKKQKLRARVIRLSLEGEMSPKVISRKTGVSELGVIKYLRHAGLFPLPKEEKVDAIKSN